MGGVVSTGRNNDELIDKLKEAEYIKSSEVEKVFRLVDRGNYITEDSQSAAYRDNAWRNGNLHISAPCIYAQVMEGLKLGAGMSFLNIGSGTGYLSTMAGLIIGPFGVNHGVELHSSVVAYARERLIWFLQNSSAIDASFFCEPQFCQGNGLSFSVDVLQYDRVYCGASCPQTHEDYMKQLIKVNGVLVMPRSDKLIKITRTSERNWVTETLIPVSFSSLVLPSQSSPLESVSLPVRRIPSLQEIARQLIRSALRIRIEAEDETLKSSFIHDVTLPVSSKKKREESQSKTFVNVSDSEYESDASNDSGSVLFTSRRLHAHQLSAFLEMAQAVAVNRRTNQDDGSTEEVESFPDEPQEENEVHPQEPESEHEEEPHLPDREDMRIRIRFLRFAGGRNENPEPVNGLPENEERPDSRDNGDSLEIEMQVSDYESNSNLQVQSGTGENIEQVTDRAQELVVPIDPTETGGVRKKKNSESDLNEDVQLNTDDELKCQKLTNSAGESNETQKTHYNTDTFSSGSNTEFPGISEPSTSTDGSAPKVMVLVNNSKTENCKPLSRESHRREDDYSEVAQGQEDDKMELDSAMELHSKSEDFNDSVRNQSSDASNQSTKLFGDTNKREKVDSGIVDDLEAEMDVQDYLSPSSSTSSNSVSDYSEDGEKFTPSTSHCGAKRNSNARSRSAKCIGKSKSRRKWTKKGDTRKKKQCTKDKRGASIDSKIYMAKYSQLMVESIKELPLPPSLKVFVNLNRPV